MSEPYGGLLKQPFILLVVLLGAIAGALFVTLDFVASSQIGEGTGVALFIVVASLLFVGYVIGVMVLAFVAVLVLTRLWRRAEK